MDEPWLNFLHIVAVMTWVGGMRVAAMAITAGSGARRPQEIEARNGLLVHVGRWDRRVTTPAMLLAWLLGLALALTGQWFPQAWLVAKLAMILLLSALHGFLSGSPRRISLGQSPEAPASLHHAPAALLAAVPVIVALVVIKPF